MSNRIIPAVGSEHIVDKHTYVVASNDNNPNSCAGCEGRADGSLCIKLPDCVNPQGSIAIVFIKKEQS